MKLTSLHALLTCMFALLFSTISAEAQPLGGKEITMRLVYQGEELTAFTQTFTISQLDIEVPDIGNSTQQIDIFDIASTQSRIRFNGLSSAVLGPSPNIVQFSDDSNAIPSFSSAILGETNWPGVDQSRVSFSANVIQFDFGGLLSDPSYFMELNIGVIPEPSTAGFLLGASALMVVFSQRRRQN